MKVIWHCVECGKDEVHEQKETTEEWENAYPVSVNSEQQEYFESIVGEEEEWDIWGAYCPACKMKRETLRKQLNREYARQKRGPTRKRRFGAKKYKSPSVQL